MAGTAPQGHRVHRSGLTADRCRSGTASGPSQRGVLLLGHSRAPLETSDEALAVLGARPSISKMGGNNGSGRGQAIAVDYQIRAHGDAEALFIDERGNEITVTCLVPPFPK